jgi:ABC-type polysaccharide/polyol phosphate transport system ATPase subunit
LEQGKILGIIGKNGSGKSTLLKAIAGIFTPDKGEIDLKNSRASLLSLGVGFQSSLSGLDNIYLSGMLLGIKRSEIHKNVDEIIEFSELEDFIYKPVNTYSSGMVSKLAFSISSILDTDILLIDEVLSVGDVGFRKKSFEKIHKIISDKTKTVLLVSHDESMVRKQCDEAIWLEQGKIIQHGDTNATVDAYLEFMEKKK